MKRIIAAVCLATFMLSGCALNNTSGGNTAPPNKAGKAAPKQAARTWKVGGFIVSTHLLPKVYNPRDPGWQSFGVGQSAIYYVPKSTPNKLVEKAGGQTHVVTNLSCATEGYVSRVGGPYLFVECSAPDGKPQGILADAKTGATWTLWQGGSVPIGTTYVSRGWAYFFAVTCEDCSLLATGAINLEAGVRKPLPSIMSDGGWGPLFAPDGTLYVQKLKDQSLVPPTDLYRMDGLTATLVAHLPSPASGIDANGTIWVSKKGGSLTPNAGSMAIRAWKPAIKASKVLTTGPGYVVYLGPTPALGANGPIRVTLAASGGSETITVGEGNVGTTFTLPDGRLVFPAPHGRWQVVTVLER